MAWGGLGWGQVGMVLGPHERHAPLFRCRSTFVSRRLPPLKVQLQLQLLPLQTRRSLGLVLGLGLGLVLVLGLVLEEAATTRARGSVY